MKHRWPRSLHCQTEAVFHSIRSIGESKTDSTLGIRSFGSWKIYRYEAHRFVEFLRRKGRDTILNTLFFQDDMVEYLEERLASYIEKKRSRQTMATTLSALSKLEYAINHYLSIHLPDQPRLQTEQIRMDFRNRSKRLLSKSSKIFDHRAYEDPIRLIKAITNGTYQLQVCLQIEAGMRAEGVGSPSNRRLKNPLTKDALRGIIRDPVSGQPVGLISSREKGGKETLHYISAQTYKKLEEHISMHGELGSEYRDYIEAINKAAMQTNQYFRGKASHGLKHNFAIERYLECVAHGMSHEMALQQTSLEMSHFRLRETLTYTRGR